MVTGTACIAPPGVDREKFEVSIMSFNDSVSLSK